MSGKNRDDAALPRGYCLTTIGEVVEERVSQDGPTKDGFIYLDIGSIDRESKTFFDLKTVSLNEAPSRARQVVQPADVLVSMTRPNLNAVAMVTDFSGEAIASTGFHVLRSPWIEPTFLLYLVQTEDFIQTMSSVVQGALYPAVRPKDISSFQFDLPPRCEQSRIVEKLEELLSDLDAGVAELKAAQRKLAQYRQSLLKAAVEGALTADWRASRSTLSRRKQGSSRSRDDHPQKRDPGLRQDDEGKETGAELLQRILSERRTRWEQKQLARFAEQGKTPPKGWQAKYSQPAIPDLTELPPLPEGWAWVTGELLFTWGSGDFLPASAQQPGSYPIYGGNGVTGSHDEANVHDGAIIVGRVGVHCGNIYLAESACWVTDNAIYATSKLDSISWQYSELALRAANIGSSAKGGAQPFVSQKTLNDTMIPLPPLQEQIAIVEAFSMAAGAGRAVEQAIHQSLAQVSAQRKNLLKSAFSGQLVPQDPNDEPASALLARIRAQREADAGTPARKRGRKARGAA